MVILDINGLKIVNDTFGHREGDQLIVQGARLIKETLGQLGEIFRIGGDEFVVLSTNIEPYFIQVELDTLNKKISAFNESYLRTKHRLCLAASLRITIRICMMSLSEPTNPCISVRKTRKDCIRQIIK